MVTVVAHHGHVASFEAVGYQDLEKKIPMRKDTLFRIASLTKPVTCAAIMILVDEGRIAVIDPIEKYLPEYANHQNANLFRTPWLCLRIRLGVARHQH